MNFEKCQIAPGYIVNIDKERYAEFIRVYYFTPETDKAAYLAQSISEGWITN